MKSYSFFRSLAAIALMACVLFYTFDFHPLAIAAGFAIALAVPYLKAWAGAAFKLFAERAWSIKISAMYCRFKTNTMTAVGRRERPTMTGSWRSCPSV